MTNNHEEWMLEQEWQEMRRETGKVSDQRLDEVLWQGVRKASTERARRLSKHRTAKRLRITAAILAVVVAGGASAAGSRMLHLTPAKEQEWSQDQLPSYTERIFQEPDNFLQMVKQAAEHGLYHEMNQSVNAGGYTLKIEGIAADSRRIIMFYTAKNGNGNLPLRLSYNHPPKLLDGQGRALQGTFTWDTYAKLPKDQPLTQGVMVFDFDTPGQLPVSFQIETTWSQLKPEGSKEQTRTETLVAPVTLQQSLHAADLEERPIHVEINQGEQQVTFTKMVQSPLRTDLVFNYKSDTGTPMDKIEATLELVSKQISSKQRLDFHTMLRYDRTQLTPNGGTIYLTSNYYSEHRELWLNFYYASFQPNHEVEITVDPDKGTISDSPDAKILIKQVAEKSSEQSLELRLLYGSKQPIEDGYFELKDTFTDAAGQSHPLVQEYRAGKGTYLSIPNYRQYPGPFRFVIRKYEGNVVQMKEAEEQRIR
ncbi:DUF4179 domain-containing protein [Paenibacillus cellulositrophicus]|uniref:DUF4179 domain-containing protein n=1 Tax=Paenibacillus cellulositrophicus TaxID=562959 RepID=UPI003F7CEDCE